MHSDTSNKKAGGRRPTEMLGTGSVRLVVQGSASFFVGAITATGILFVLFVINLIWRGQTYYEWGFFRSFGISSAVLTVDYTLASMFTVLILHTIKKKVLVDLKLFLLLGLITALVLFVSFEIPLIALPLQKSFDWTTVQLIGVIISCLIVIGYTLILSNKNKPRAVS